MPARKMEIAHIAVDDIYGKPLPAQQQQAVLSVIGPDKDKLDTLNYLNKKVEELFSHQFYNKIEYAFVPNGDGTKNLNLFLRPTEPSLQLALHYDTNEFAGIIFRYKRNNLWLNNSRFSADADFSQYNKLNLSYLKYLNPLLNVWLKAEYGNYTQKYNNLDFRKISELEHFSVTSMQHVMERVKLSAGYSPSISSSITASVEYNLSRLEKNSGKLVTIFNKGDSASGSLMYLHNYFNASVAFNHNTLNTDLYPTSGNRLKLKAGLFFGNVYSQYKPAAGDVMGEKFYDLLNPKSYGTENSAQPVLQLSAQEFFAFPLSNKLALQGRLFYGLNFRKKDNNLVLVRESEFLYLANKFNLGGYNNFRYDEQIPFAGLLLK